MLSPPWFMVRIQLAKSMGVLLNLKSMDLFSTPKSVFSWSERQGTSFFVSNWHGQIMFRQGSGNCWHPSGPSRPTLQLSAKGFLAPPPNEELAFGNIRVMPFGSTICILYIIYIYIYILYTHIYLYLYMYIHVCIYVLYINISIYRYYKYRQI